MNRRTQLILECTVEGQVWMQPHPRIKGHFLPSDTPNLTEMFILSTYYLNTILLLQTDAHNYKIIGILKQLRFRLSL